LFKGDKFKLIKTEDPRVSRTRLYLREALILEIEKFGFEGVTVQSLTRQAGINRATFYQHYRDKYDLLEKSIDEMIQSLKAVALPNCNKIEINNELLIPLFQRILNFVEEHPKFFSVMLGEKGIPSFQLKLVELTKKNITYVINSHFPGQNHMKNEFIITYVATANIGLLNQWLKDELPYSTKFMAEQMANIFIHGPLNLLSSH
jgi:AcrR family transcriptional regulator